MHITNFKNLNKDYVSKHFIKNGKFQAREFMKYFNVTYCSVQKYKKLFNLNIQNYKSNNTSQSEEEWLNKIGIPNDKEHRQVRLGKYIVDGYNPETKIVYEYLGDFWHGNITRYNPNDLNVRSKTSYQSLFDNTVQKLDILKNLGYNILWTWDTVFKDKKSDICWCYVYNNEESLLKYIDDNIRDFSNYNLIKEDGNLKIYTPK